MINDRARDAYSVQQYAPRTPIDGVQWVELRRFYDDGGSMTELARLNEGLHKDLPGFVVRQMNYSEMEPAAVKAFHLHQRQTDVWFIPPDCKMLVVLGDVRKGSPTEGAVHRLVLGDGMSRLLRIPPGVAHGARKGYRPHPRRCGSPHAEQLEKLASRIMDAFRAGKRRIARGRHHSRLQIIVVRAAHFILP